MTQSWLALLGGMALFTFGLSQTSESLRRLTAGWLKSLLLVMTKNPLGSVILGITTTMLAGSSSAITVMVVSFVSAGLLELRQALEVILGAAIGTTLTVQLISFDFIRYAPILVFLGVVILIIQRGKDNASLGSLTLGFGLIFYGMMVMIGAVHNLSTEVGVRSALKVLNHHALLTYLLVLLFTAVIQNSATVIALAITFRLHGLISLPTGLVIVFAANVGSTAAAMYSAWLGGSRSAKRTATAYFLMKFSLSLLALASLGPFEHVLLSVETAPGRVLADAHTLFNILLAVLFLPFLGPIARLMQRWLPDIRPKPISPLLDMDLLDDPHVALTRAAQEIARMARIIQNQIFDNLPAYLEMPRESISRSMRQAESDVDLLHHAITHYLFQLGQVSHLTDAELTSQVRLLYLANHLEHLSDTAIKVMNTRDKLVRRNFSWPPALWTDTLALLTRLDEQYHRLADAISLDDDEQALSLVQENPELLRQEAKIRLNILTHVEESQLRFTSTLLELSDDLSLLTNRIAAVSRALLGII
ncbi:Na/Pi cotransporter family protein [Sulfobacillus thermosulfidooxidans]|uniref:Na/Pi cotransporter family protein n=1 Tax=Sulfobacillus thermosulfidooxidans TaxID=28034 RepID=UPI0006B4E59D|nr:Na/Pi symporter [Sulfobacillus thermosulfidooxidans]